MFWYTHITLRQRARQSYYAFNTIQPHLMVYNLIKLDVNSTIILQIFPFLINRPQRVRISNSTTEVLSNEIRTKTGAPQGCVLSLALFNAVHFGLPM